MSTIIHLWYLVSPFSEKSFQFIKEMKTTIFTLAAVVAALAIIEVKGKGIFKFSFYG